MASSIYKIAEKVRDIIGKGDMQSLISSCIDAYGVVVKREWYENKNADVNEIDGVFIYSFGADGSLSPVFDSNTDTYYIVVPSSYLRLPAESGINMVSFIKGQNKPFMRIGAGSVGMWSNLLANVMGGHQTYFVEGTRMYFPKMTGTTNGNIMLKLTVALDAIDPEENLNIPPDVQSAIIDLVVAKYQIKKEVKPETLQ